MSGSPWLALMAATMAAWPAEGGAESAAPAPAELAWLNGNIYTLDPDRPRAEALAVRGGRLVAVGSNAEIRARIGPATTVLDLAGQTVIPGLIDSHAHVAGLGSFHLGRLDLGECRSFDEVVATVAARVRTAKKGEWILGGRWDHERWPGRALPMHAALTAVSPDNPVWLRRVDGHAGLANAAAMQRAGIARDTPEPPGGDIVRDERGEPTGLFIDNAGDLIEKQIGDSADPAALILKAQEVCLSVGLTGVHDAGVAPAEIEVYRRLADSGGLKLRMYVMVSAEHAPAYFAAHGLLISERLTVRSAKLYVDGALGSRGAWLLAPYRDRPTDEEGRPYAGLNLMTPAFIREIAADGLARGYQVCTHAIGDRGNRETLDAYEAALRASPRPDPRFRIEHAQVVAPDDLPRFARLGVIPAMQPTHCTSDMRWVYERIGPERAAGAYAWASLRRTGVPVPGGSDFPVESPDPLRGIYAAVTRQDADGQPPGGWHPQERMTREEAVCSFTRDAAYAAFEEHEKGRLAPGRLADFVVLDRDILTCAPREILEARVLRTVIGGETVYPCPAAGS